MKRNYIVLRNGMACESCHFFLGLQRLAIRINGIVNLCNLSFNFIVLIHPYSPVVLVGLLFLKDTAIIVYKEGFAKGVRL